MATNDEDAVSGNPITRRKANLEQIWGASAVSRGHVESEPDETPAPAAPAAEPDAAPPAVEEPAPAAPAQEEPPAETPPEAAEAAPAPAPAESAAAGVTDDTLIKTTVDGVETEVPLGQLRANFQKGAAADSRLTQATAILDFAERSQERAASGDPATQPELQPGAVERAGSGPPAKRDLPQSVKDQTVKVVEKMQYGEDGEGAQALQDLITEVATSDAAPGQPAATAEDITAQVANMIEYHGAQKFFTDNYADVESSPILVGVFNQLFGSMLNQFLVDHQKSGGTLQRPSYQLMVDAAGKKVREYAGDIARDFGDAAASSEGKESGESKGKVTVAVDPRRTEAKQAAVATPTPRAPAARTPSPTATTAAPTRLQKHREGILEIQRARGQAPQPEQATA